MNQFTFNSNPNQYGLRPNELSTSLNLPPAPISNGTNFTAHGSPLVAGPVPAYNSLYDHPLNLEEHPKRELRGIEGANANLAPVAASASDENLLLNKLGLTAAKLELWKRWGLSTMKCTRQLVAERFGKGVRTIDLELESRIEMVRDLKAKYTGIMRLTRALASHTFHAKQAQLELSEVFTGLASKSPELQEEFTYNAETQRLIVKNMELFIQALNFFVSNIDTLVNKTIEDSLLTVKQYEATRLEFDAHRSDLEELQNLAKSKPVPPARIEEYTENFNGAKDKFDKIRNDLSIKLKFLDENRIKVIRKQLMMFHNAISAYYTGNQAAMEAVIKQYSIKAKTSNSPSWLENFTL